MANPTERTTVQKDTSQLRPNKMLAEHFTRLAQAPATGETSAYNSVPGNMTALLQAFDVLPVLPEINALQSGMRGKSKAYIAVPEKLGHSEDVCTYVKSDIGMMKSGHIGPTGERLPEPDLLLLSYTGCFTFMKWFELFREEYKCPVVLVPVPYQGEGRVTESMRRYVVDQIRQKLIPALEKITGKSYEEDGLKECLAPSAQAGDDLGWGLQSAKNKPSPIDAYFRGVYHIGTLLSSFRGTADAVEYYKALRAETEESIRLGKGPVTPH